MVQLKNLTIFTRDRSRVVIYHRILQGISCCDSAIIAHHSRFLIFFIKSFLFHFTILQNTDIFQYCKNSLIDSGHVHSLWVAGARFTVEFRMVFSPVILLLSLTTVIFLIFLIKNLLFYFTLAQNTDIFQYHKISLIDTAYLFIILLQQKIDVYRFAT